MPDPYYHDSRPSRSARSFSGAVTVAGTPQQITIADLPCIRIWIQSNVSNGVLANDGVLVVGGDGIIATEATRKGRALYANQGDWFSVRNANSLWIDSTDSGAKYHGIVEIHE